MNSNYIKSLSIIFPFFNEDKRILKIIKKIKFLIYKFKNFDLEIILVNDGSTDKSLEFIKKKLNHKKVKLISYLINKGKGYALKQGVRSSTKKWILTCDIDFAANPENILEWQSKKFIKNRKSCYFGSRVLKKSKVKSKFIRKFIGTIFSNIRKLLLNINVQDTQCGFKLYPNKIGKKIFSKINSNGYIHDIEIFILLNKFKIKFYELPIKWNHVPGSKVNIFFDSIKMLFQLIYLRIYY